MQESAQLQKVAVISGGSKGLGRCLAERFLALGYRVATFSRTRNDFIDAKGTEDPNETRFLWRAVDSSDPKGLDRFVGEVMRQFGRVDVLVNNAGIGLDGVLTLTRRRDIETTLAVNVAGTIALTQRCVKHMLRRRGGSIVNISSVNAVRGHVGVAVYSATKAALDGFGRSLARELGARNIRVNAVAPGYFDSDMVSGLTEDTKERIRRRTPLGRLGSAEEIANCVIFLCSEESAFVTGQTLVVDGGITC